MARADVHVALGTDRRKLAGLKAGGAGALLNRNGNAIRSVDDCKNSFWTSSTIHLHPDEVLSIRSLKKLRGSTTAMMPLAAGEIANTIKCLKKNNKASDDDDLPSEIYKHTADAIATIRQQIFPRAWGT